jgi:hypothetical protein
MNVHTYVILHVPYTIKKKQRLLAFSTHINRHADMLVVAKNKCATIIILA